MLYCPVNGGQVVSLLKQASDKEYAFIYYELFVQVKGIAAEVVVGVGAYYGVEGLRCKGQAGGIRLYGTI